MKVELFPHLAEEEGRERGAAERDERVQDDALLLGGRVGEDRVERRPERPEEKSADEREDVAVVDGAENVTPIVCAAFLATFSPR